MKGFKGVRNINGRPKGTPNRNTAEIRANFQLLIENNISQLEKDLKSLEPKDRIKIILELARFILPTLKSIETDGGTDQTVNILNLGAGINPDLSLLSTDELIKRADAMRQISK